MTARILCVESDVTLLESRCAVLKIAGYDVASSSPRVAEIVLGGQKFDLIIITSSVNNFDTDRINNLADGAEVMVLEGCTMPTDLLSMVEERLNGRRRA